ncbi:MAG: glycosyltransferase [Acidimicrobiales bacterium]|nr:glycosyltransferase [Acidimicrobiales bacterium]
MKLQARVAVHIPGAAQLRDGVVGLPGNMGAMVRGLADAVAHLDVVAYDPPAHASENRDRPEYEFDAPASLRVVSLGSKGSVRDFPQRRRRVAAIVREASGDWDLTIYRLVNRRAGLVARANRSPRVVGYIGGHTATTLAQTHVPAWRRLAAKPALYAANRGLMSIARSAGLFLANGEELVDRYNALGISAELLRTSSTFEADFFTTSDRFTEPEIRLVVAGRVTAAKGVLDAFEAFQIARERLSRHVRLLIVGDGDAVPELRARVYAAGLGDVVEFRGWQPAGPKVLAQLREGDALVHLSKAESMPRMVWEAMSQSVPVVATPVGSLPRVFDDAEHLLFVPLEDPEAVADAIVRLADDQELRRKLIAAGAEAVKDVSVESITADLIGRITRRWPELALA